MLFELVESLQQTWHIIVNFSLWMGINPVSFIIILILIAISAAIPKAEMIVKKVGDDKWIVYHI